MMRLIIGRKGDLQQEGVVFTEDRVCDSPAEDWSPSGWEIAADVEIDFFPPAEFPLEEVLYKA